MKGKVLLTAVLLVVLGAQANASLVSSDPVSSDPAIVEEPGMTAGGGLIENIRNAVPIPAAAWWIGSALMGLTIVARRRDGKPSED